MTKTEADGAYAFDDLLWGTYAVRGLIPSEDGEGEDPFAGSALDELFGDTALLPEIPGAYYDCGGLAPLFWGETFIGEEREGVSPPGGADDLWYAAPEGETDVPSAAFFADLLDGTCQIASAGPTAGEDRLGPLGGSILVDMPGTELPADSSALVYDFADDQPRTPAALAPADGLVEAVSDFGPGPNLPEPAASVEEAVAADGFALSALPAGGEGLDYGSAAVRPACLGGVVWAADKEFADEPGTFSLAGKAGVTVELTGTDDQDRAVSRTTASDSEGRYHFEGLYPGEYAVRVATPRGFRAAEARPGSKGGRAQARRQIDAIRLDAGDDASGYEFSYEGTGQIAGRATSRQGPAKRTVGTAGVTLVLTGTGRDGRAIDRTVKADAKGKYLFHALPPGTYRVEVKADPDLAPWVLSPAQVNGRPSGVPAGDAVAVEGIPLGADGRATGLDFTATGGVG